MSNYYDLIKKGLSGAVNVAAGAVSKAAEVAKDLAEDLTSVKALKDYKLAGHVATAGPGSSWKIYNAISKKPGGCGMDSSSHATACSCHTARNHMHGSADTQASSMSGAHTQVQHVAHTHA
jgi:hypothetical protein